MCEYEGKRYRQHEKFSAGVNGCAQCVCIDGNVNCDESKCQILVDPPELPTSGGNTGNIVPQQPAFVEPVAQPRPAATTTTVRPPVRSDSQGSEKGPSASELSYYASRLTDANINAQKGPPEPMAYYPEQMQYLQTGAPGLRGPPGKYSSNI